jgi:putative membrane protein
VIADLLRGAFMGGADVIPGVSGGTIALIVGVYERLITAIRALAAAILLVLRADLAGARRRLAEVDWWMLVPLVVGIGVALVIGLRTIPPLLDRHPVAMRALLFGLVLASVQVPWRRLSERSLRTLAVLAAAAAVAFALVGVPPAELADPPLPYVFGAAMLSLCAMILPGVSGAFLLEAVGVYRPLGDAVSGVDVAFLVTFAAGGALGLAIFAKLLELVLRRAPDLTMAALTGLLVGALRALWPWQAADRALLAPEPDAVGLAIGLAAAGVVAVTALVQAGEWSDRRRRAEAGGG